VLDTASRVSDETEAEALEGEEAVAEAEPQEGPSKAAGSALGGGLQRAALGRLARRVMPALWAAAVIAAGSLWGIEPAFLVAAAGALGLVITLMWSSVQSLTGGAVLGFEEALGMGAPSRVEEQKRSVLRALKDLEYEKSVGKISAEDYAELSARYRAEAKSLIQSMDEALGPARREVEASLEKHLARAGLEPVAPPPAAAEPLAVASAEAGSAPLSEPAEPDPKQAPEEAKP